MALLRREAQLAGVPQPDNVAAVRLASHHVVRPDVATDPGLLTRTNRTDARVLGALKNAVHGVHCYAPFKVTVMAIFWSGKYTDSGVFSGANWSSCTCHSWVKSQWCLVQVVTSQFWYLTTSRGVPGSLIVQNFLRRGSAAPMQSCCGVSKMHCMSSSLQLCFKEKMKPRRYAAGLRSTMSASSRARTRLRSGTGFREHIRPCTVSMDVGAPNTL